MFGVSEICQGIGRRCRVQQVQMLATWHVFEAEAEQSRTARESSQLWELPFSLRQM